MKHIENKIKLITEEIQNVEKQEKERWKRQLVYVSL